MLHPNLILTVSMYKYICKTSHFLQIRITIIDRQSITLSLLLEPETLALPFQTWTTYFQRQFSCPNLSSIFSQ